MSERSAQHATFIIERDYPDPPAKVFGAWATPQGKAAWFAGGAEWKEDLRELDFRVGGHERLRGIWPGGRVSDYAARYHDIVDNRRIVYSYDMHIDATRVSVSLSTVVLTAFAGGTRLTYTERAVYLDGYDDAGSRERGTRALLDRLHASLARTDGKGVVAPAPRRLGDNARSTANRRPGRPAWTKTHST